MKIALFNAARTGSGRSVAEGLRHQGIESVDLDEFDIEDAKEAAQEITMDGADYAAVLVSLSGKGMDTYQIRALSHGGVKVPIIALLEAQNLTGRVHALDNGASHAFSYPVAMDELAATIRAAVRMKSGNTASIVEVGNLVIDTARRVAYIRSTMKAIHLTGKEYKLLEALAVGKGRTFTKETILSALYVPGVEDEPELKIIDVFICKLRKKIAAENGGEHYIQTVWGRGYKLDDLDTTAAPVAVAS